MSVPLSTSTAAAIVEQFITAFEQADLALRDDKIAAVRDYDDLQQAERQFRDA